MSAGRQPECLFTESTWLHANVEPGHRRCTNYAIWPQLSLSSQFVILHQIAVAVHPKCKFHCHLPASDNTVAQCIVVCRNGSSLLAVLLIHETERISHCLYKVNHQDLTYAFWLLSCTVCRDSCGRFDFLGMKIKYIHIACNTICQLRVVCTIHSYSALDRYMSEYA